MINTLTPRERRAVELVAQGHTDEEICALTHVSDSTHRRRLDLARQKLGARNRAHAAALAVAAGIVKVTT